MANKLINSDNIAQLAFLLEARNKAYTDSAVITDYNDLENRPCYDDRVSTTIIYEYDGIEEGKVTGEHGVSHRHVVKVADFSADQLEFYKEALENGYKVTYTKDGENVTYESNRVHVPYSGMTHCICAAPESGMPDLVVFAYDTFSISPPYSSYYITEPGIYFMQSSSYQVSKIEFVSSEGELKPLDLKYLTKTAGHDVTDKTYIMSSSHYTTHKYVTEGEELVADIGAEVFNDNEMEGDNIAIGVCSHAEGHFTLAKGNFTHSEGNDTTAIGTASHAEGYDTFAVGTSSHAEGHTSEANGNYSHAEGYGTKANAWATHSEGWSTEANGSYSHAEGYFTKSNGSHSHAEGCYTIASGENQHVQGKYNIEDTENKYANIVGNGTDENARNNAHTLDWNGNAWFAGKVTAVGAPTEANDLTNKAYVDNKLSTIDAITLNGYSIWVGTSEELPSEEDRDVNTLYFEIGEEESDDVVENNIANGKLTLTTDKYQKVLNMVSGTEIVFPTASKFTEIHLFFLADSNMDLVLPEGCKWRVDANIEAGNAYELVFKYNTLCWLADILVYS